MKKLITSIAIAALSLVSIAQSPSKFSYQATVRNATGELIVKSAVGVRISILQGSANGTTIFVESHTATTNANGLFTLAVGAGNAVSGTFSTINWANGPFFLKSEIDPSGGSNYLAASTMQLMSVPYALHSSSTSSVDWNNIQNKPAFGTGTFSGSYLDLTNKPLIINNTFTGNYTDLTNKPALFTGSYNDLTNKPVIVNNTFTGSYNDLTNKPIIPASFSGSYLDLTNKPTITTFSGNYLDLTNKPTLAIVATTGSYNDLTNKPIIPASFSGSYLDLTNKPTITTFSGSYLDLSNKPTLAIVATTGSYNDLTNKPIIPASFSGSYLDLTNKPTITTFSGNYLDLTNKPALAIVATTGSYNDLTNKPIIPASFSGSYLDLTNKPTITTFSGSYLDLSNKPTLAIVATTGSYNDLTNKPIIPASFSGSYLDLTNKPTITTFSGSYLDLSNKPTLAIVATTGSYNDLTNKPIIPASFSGSYLDLTNKPTIINNTFTGSYTDLTNKPVIINNTFTGSYTDLTNKPIIPASFSGSYLDLTNKPTIINNTFTGSYTDLTNKLTFAVVATTGSYNDLTNKPVIINNTFSGSYTDLTNKLTFAVVATTGSYNDLTNKPILTTLTGGTGITVNGTNQIINTAPDINITLTGINVSISGTYPAFTVTGTTPTIFTGGTGISITGSNQIVNTAPMPNGTIAGQMLYWDGTAWKNIQPGARNKTLTFCDGAPTWGQCLPVVSTNAPNTTYYNNVTISGNFIDYGGNITAHGFCINTAPNPNLSNMVINIGFTSEIAPIPFESSIYDLSQGTTYYIRAYATNSSGTVFGNEQSFTTSTTIYTASIGDSYQGGIVAYILQPADAGYDANAQHGLIAAPSDQSTGIEWYNGSYINTGATSATAIGTGNANTNAIITAQGTGSYAAKLCADLTIGVYSDWFLPSLDELAQLYANRTSIGISGFSSNYYWSSSESYTYNAYYFGFGFGSFTAKYTKYYVRAIRTF